LTDNMVAKKLCRAGSSMGNQRLFLRQFQFEGFTQERVSGRA